MNLPHALFHKRCFGFRTEGAMRLTLYTDYSLRVLLYLAAVPEGASSINDVADAYQISRNHLRKVVNDLARPKSRN